MIKKCLAARQHSLGLDVALLLLRLIVGAAFLKHGWTKIQNPLHWMGPNAPIPAPFLFLASVAEFGGGLALVLGLLTRLGALGIFCTMTVATFTVAVWMGGPFVSPTGGLAFELPL